VMDPGILKQRPPYPVPDSVYWSPMFRDTTSVCAQGHPGKGGCGTWVYKVSKHGDTLSLVRLDSLSRATSTVATKAVLTRDTLLNCFPLRGCGAAAPADWLRYYRGPRAIEWLKGYPVPLDSMKARPSEAG
jgi:hypothetical protein